MRYTNLLLRCRCFSTKLHYTNQHLTFLIQMIFHTVSNCTLTKLDDLHQLHLFSHDTWWNTTAVLSIWKLCNRGGHVGLSSRISHRCSRNTAYSVDWAWTDRYAALFHHCPLSFSHIYCGSKNRCNSAQHLLLQSEVKITPNQPVYQCLLSC